MDKVKAVGFSSGPNDFRGVRVTSEELLRLRGDAARLAPKAADTVSSLFPGAYRTLIRGRGLDFEEVRIYHPGDDYRVLDWRVTARTGKLHTKVFHEEREHNVYFVVDGSPSMHFGTRGAYKFVAAARAAALLAWVAVDNGDKAGGMVFGDGAAIHEQGPFAGATGAAHLFGMLELASTRGGGGEIDNRSTLSSALQSLRRLVRPGSLILVVSDFLNRGADFERHLNRLARNNDVAGLLVSDPLERAFPADGLYPVSDGERSLWIDGGDNDFAKAFSNVFTANREEIGVVFRKARCRLFDLGTEQPVLDGLRSALFGIGGER